MANPRLDNFRPLLAAMIRQLFEADPLDDVRAVTAHGARLISPYDVLTLRERGVSGPPVVSLRQGEELDAGAKALERHLCDEALRTGRAASTLDMLASEQAQSLADAYVRRNALCLARPLRVFGEEFGTLTLHYESRPALADAEFDALRTFADYAAIALYNAHARQDLRDFAYTDSLTGLASRRQLDVELTRLRDRAGGVALQLDDQVLQYVFRFVGRHAARDEIAQQSGAMLKERRSQQAARKVPVDLVHLLPSCLTPAREAGNRGAMAGRRSTTCDRFSNSL